MAQEKKKEYEQKNYEHDTKSSCVDRSLNTVKSNSNRCESRKGCQSKRSCPFKVLSTHLADVHGMDPQASTEFVQILNWIYHWILISTVNCPPSTIDIYDSLELSLSLHLTLFNR